MLSDIWQDTPIEMGNSDSSAAPFGGYTLFLPYPYFHGSYISLELLHNGVTTQNLHQQCQKDNYWR